MSVAYISIGSNLGNRRANCKKAIDLLRTHGVTVSKVSSIIDTEPWGVKDQPPFVNLAIEIKTDKTPEELLRLLNDIESTLGRTRGKKWGPRIIDLDILFYDDIILNTPDIEIPHPYIEQREFVLRPLSEIAPSLIHPVSTKTVIQMLEDVIVSRKSLI